MVSGANLNYSELRQGAPIAVVKPLSNRSEMATRRRVLNTFLALGEHFRGARRLPHPGPAPHDRANRDSAATLACAERDDLCILNVVGARP